MIDNESDEDGSQKSLGVPVPVVEDREIEMEKWSDPTDRQTTEAPFPIYIHIYW